MKLYSKGGKYVADPKPVKTRRTKPATTSEEKIVPVVAPTLEAKPVPEERPVHVAKPVREARPARETKPIRETRPTHPAKTTTRRTAVTRPDAVSEAKIASGTVPARRRRTQAKSRKNMRIWVTALLIFFAIIALTLLFLFVRKAKAANEFRQLAEQIQANVEAEAAAPPATEYIGPSENTPEGMVPKETEPPVKTILPKYAELYQNNTEFFGWVRIDDTTLDYPVMRSHDDNEEYLYANFNGEYSYAGTPFADIQCSHDSDNIMIYGHNIRDGSMFRSLMKYEKESYWKKHPTIMFSDLYEDYEYEVLAAFYDRVYLKTDTCFKFYQFIDAENEADFDYAISQFKEKSLYDTGVDAEYGDKLITLVTCAYHVENGRFVVVARRK